MIKFLLAALLALPAAAQEWNSACFMGLSDADTPATLSPCESPDALNVESNLDGTAILKRKGFSKSADLTVATSPVTGSHSFIDSSGNRLDIVCQDRNCAKSTNGNAFATFLTTATAGIVRWSFVDVGGILYGANDKRDLVMRYDGTTRTSAVNIPQGSILELTQDRLAVGDISGQPNRVHRSSAGAYEQFTVGVNPEDSFFDDYGAAGDRIRGMKCIGGNCFYFKTASITMCAEANQYNTDCSVISPNIGTTDPASIVAAGSTLYFRAQDKNYWEIDRGGLRQISKKIPNLVKSQSGGLGGGENTNTQTTKADWDAGVQNPLLSWNTETTNGSIFASSVTLVDTSSTDFSGGTLTNLSLTDSVGSVRLSSTVVEDIWANNLVAGRLGWTVGSGQWQMTTISGQNYVYANVAGNPGQLTHRLYTSSATISTGSWRFDWYYTYTGPFFSICGWETSGTCFQFEFMTNDGGNYYYLQVNDNADATSPVKTVALKKTVAGSTTTLTTTTTSLTVQTNHTFEITRSSDGRFFLYADSVLISSTSVGDVSITSSTRLNIYATSNSEVYDMWNAFSDLYIYKYSSTGTITSRIFDTAFSTPTWGALSSTFTASNAANEGNIAFYVQSSTAGDGGGFGTSVSSSDTLRPSTLAQKRYVRYSADFSTLVSTKTPSLDAISLTAATTGQFVTQCIQPNASISAWGTLSCAETKAGAGSLVYYATSAATCAGLPTTPPVNAAGSVQSGWTAQTNNATVTISTNAAVYIGWRSLLGSATDQAQVDSCVLAWNEGTPVQPAWAAYDSVKNSIYWTTTIGGASSTNRLLKYDRNLEQWYPFDIKAQAPRVINNSLYFGGASSGTWNLYGLTDSDNGGAINAYWESKDVGSDKPFHDKTFGVFSLLARNQGTGSMTATWTNSIGNTGDFTVSLSTGAGITYSHTNYNLPKRSPQSFMNIRLGNNSSTPFEVLGIGLTWTVAPWKVQ